MIEKGNVVPGLVILFDANMPSMDLCQSDCKNNDRILCFHRFNFNACTLHLNNKEHSFSDLDVVLSFCRWIEISGNPRSQFVIVTRDLDFLKDVKKEYKIRRRKDKHVLKFIFYRDMIEVLDVKSIINIKSFRFKKQNRKHILRTVIDYFNNP